MKISKYLGFLVKEYIEAFGFLMIIVTIFLKLYSKDTISSSLLWQILLVASAYIFFKFALVNKYELGKRAQTISFFICFILADLMVVLWLMLFSPGKVVRADLIIGYIVVILIVKGLVYAMMYSDGKTQAKELNKRLKEYNNG